jgi:hypothetical protein
MANPTTVFLFLSSLPSTSIQESPFVKDQTGIQWVLPFEKGLSVAKERNRLLLVKPIAFGTTRSGHW